MTANEEQALLTILRENSDIEVTEILARLASSEYAYLSREQIETHLAQLRPWLQPWRGRHGRSGSKTASVAAELNKNGVAESAASSKKQFHENLLAAFPLRQLLEKRYEFRGSSPEMAQALSFYDNGDDEQALGYIALLSEDYSAAIDSLTTALRLDKNLQPFEQFAERLIAALLNDAALHL
ncbi:MAG: hypothetical protein ONB46_17075 [candidate division KSB1 bacterium]|nr:hypothetical protein [candidate division KSB1 bacterium]MDZ7367453.1 hypothetical protein [candidate division KSB1 bacterium]MDZ7405442.1 hypothetical protein [candidate division KSB1 bacterium]